MRHGVIFVFFIVSNSMSADLFYLGRIEEGMELLENQEQDFTVKLIKG